MPSEHRHVTEPLTLAQAAQTLLDECRMVLPGIQALFGFQLIAVFNDGFEQRLGAPEQQLHLAALVLVAIAIAIIMTPAAFHRQKGALAVTRRFVDVSTLLLLWSMAPLALAICLEVYVVAQLIVPASLAAALTAGLLAAFALLWFVVPRAQRLQRRLAS
jgi:hypothetical protein